LPCVIHYHGFGGSSGTVSDFSPWLLMGCAVISVDIREQQGATGSAGSYTSGTANSVVTKGILDRDEYYYGHVYTDCVRAVDVAARLDRIDGSCLIVDGASQGGGIATAVAALDERPVIALTDVPSNSNFERRLEIKVGPYSGTGAFANVNEYLRKHPRDTERVFDTLSYFDTMNMADRIRCKVLASVGLDDITCPPECYFATYNRITSDKEVEIYPFNGHEGGGSLQTERKLQFLGRYLNEAR
jgi:cephalosporin-C deacetylase